MFGFCAAELNCMHVSVAVPGYASVLSAYLILRIAVDQSKQPGQVVSQSNGDVVTYRGQLVSTYRCNKTQ
jgi:hypothetical protein